jgi:hypothetical protein
VNAQLNRQLDDFARKVILPGLKLIEQYCNGQGDKVRLAIGRPTGDPVLDQLLTELPRPTELRWLVASLRIRRMVLLEDKTFFDKAKNRFYLAVEVEADADESIRGVPSVFCDYQRRVGFRRSTDVTAMILRPVDLLDYFFSYSEAFEEERSATQSGTNAVVSEAPKPKVEPVQPMANVQPVATPVAKPDPPPLPEDPYKLTAAAQLKVQAAQQKKVDALLEVLGLQGAFKHLHSRDLERGSAWSRKVLENRPATEGDYQRAYDALCQQAIGFVRSLQIKYPTLREFADYFDIYWTKAQDTCTVNQGDQPYEAAFIAQVQAFGKPNEMNRAQASVEQDLRLVVRSLERQCGPLDVYGRREYIGSYQIERRLPTEEMIRAIRKKKVLFEELSWGVLQIYQNAGWLPRSEKSTGWSLVACFSQSAQRTIASPTEAVDCNTENAEFCELRFERRFSEGGVGWRAIAVVRVNQSGWIKLHTYRFEPYESA